MKAYYNDIDPYCCRVLRKQIAAGNLPPGDVDERDIRDVKASDLEGYGHIHLFAGIGGFPLGFMRAGVPDEWRIVTGGFPCQDISNCGHKAGIDGERSGLWREMHRILGVIRPRFAVVENVSALTVRGIGRVLGDLADIGFDAEWETISACSFGAPHARERVFIIADATGGRLQGCMQAECFNSPASEGWNGEPSRVLSRAWNRWTNERSDSRVANGISGRVGRVKSAGNAVVPQVAEYIGRRIVASLTPGGPQP